MSRMTLLLVLLALVAAMWVMSFVTRDLESVAAGVLPVEPRSFESLTVVTVGTGGTFENHQRLGPCIAVGVGEEIALVDAGRGVAEALRSAGIPVSQPATLLLTSLLPENTVGIDDLLAVRALDPAAVPLRVMGPPGTRSLVEALVRAHGEGSAVQARGFGSTPQTPAVGELAGGESLALGGLALTVAALPDGPVPALAHRLEAGGRSVVVASVGWAPEALVAFATGADLWVHEAFYRESLDQAIAAGADDPELLRAEADRHTALEDVGTLARRAGVGVLVLTRLRPPPVYAIQYSRLVGADFRGRVVIADDGDVLVP